MSDKDASKKSFCKYCGTEIKKDSTFCKKCGKPVQTNNVSHMNFWESIEWKNVVIGSVIGSIIGIILFMLFSGIIKYNLLYFIFFLIVTLSSGIYAGYSTFGDVKKRTLNGAIAGGIPFVVFTLIYNLITVFGFSLYFFDSNIFSYGLILIILGVVFGALGGLIGVLINKSKAGNSKALIGVVCVIVISVLILFIFASVNTSNSAEYKVGNSNFLVPKEYEMSSTGELEEPYGNLTNLNSTKKSISVVEYIDKGKWDEKVSSFRIPDRTIRGELLYKETDKTINGTSVIMFEDTGMPYKYYFFEKNGKYYSIDIYLPDNSNIHDDLANMVISSLKTQSNNPLTSLFS